MASGIATITLNGDSISVLADPAEDFLWLQTKWLDFGDPRNEKYLDSVSIDITDPDDLANVVGTLYYTDRLNDDPSQMELDFSTSDGTIVVNKKARYFKLKIEDRGPTVRWKLSAISFFGYKIQGRMA